MAEIVVGPIVSAVIDVLINMASSKVAEFFDRQELDDELLKTLKESLRSVQKVVNDAEKKEITDPGVKDWIDDLREVCFEADDFLDGIAYEALQLELEAEPQTRKGKGIVQNCFSCLNYPRGKGMREKQAELEKILQRIEGLVKQKDTLGLIDGIVEKSWSPKTPTTSLPKDSDIFGRDKDKEDIVKLLLSADDGNGKNPGVVPIVGMGGVGKTTLAQHVYNDTTVQRWFNVKAWVCVSEESDIVKLTRDVLKEVSSMNCDTMTPNQLHNKLAECLKGKKFLLVLDDVWNRYAWDFLLTPLKSGSMKGSKIVVTTRNESVVSVISTVPSRRLQNLTEDDCWLIFEKHAFDDGNSSEHAGLKKIGREIVRKCKGLPLAAKAIGGLLRSNADADEWKKILDNDMWDFEDGEILPALRLSYHYLPSHLKQCFAYCALFPKDYEFQKEELVLLWMAEGFLVQPEGKGIEVGNKYFDNLVSRSFFQLSTIKPSRFIMHDLINDLAKFVSGEFCFRFEDDNLRKPSKKVRYLSYAKTKYDESENFDVLCETQFLRSFLLIGWPRQLQGDDNNRKLDSLKNLEGLRVLSLSKYRIATELPDSIGNFRHVRYLNLKKMAIKSLPESVSNLYNLQILILYCCNNLTELPTNMMKLINLCHLDIRGTQLQSMPPQMGKLVKLQKLTNFLVGNQGESSIAELGKLKQLQGELRIWNLQNVASVQDVEKADLKSKYLKELEFMWEGPHYYRKELHDSSHPAPEQGSSCSDISQHQMRVLEQLRPHTNVETLSIRWYPGAKFPDWLGDSSFSKIVSLKLERCKNCFSLPPLGQLASLEDLSITKFDAVVDVGPEFFGRHKKPFGSLKILRFEAMPTWREWNCDVDGAFPLLRRLSIEGCPNLTKALPSHLPSLTTLRIARCDQLLVASLPRVPTTVEMDLMDDCRYLQLVTLPSGKQKLEVHRFHFLDSPLKVIEHMGDVSTTLESIFMNGCHLESFCPYEGSLGTSLSSVRSLDILKCPNLVSFPEGMHSLLPSLTELGIRDCNKLAANFGVQWDLRLFPSLTHFGIDVESLPLNYLLPSTLTSLRIGKIQNLNSLDVKKTLQHLTSLTKLEIFDWSHLQSIPEEGLPSTLASLEIERIQNLQSLRLQHLTSLKELMIKECPKFESIPEEGLPSTLTSLTIWSLKNLQSLEIQHLTSLEKLMIRVCPKLESIPDKWLPCTLTSLVIINLKNLQSLGAQQLTSLGELYISECPKLESIPQGLPSSLSLVIMGCRLLAKRYKREEGEDWRKISHILDTTIYDF